MLREDQAYTPKRKPNKGIKFGHRELRKMEFLQVYDIHNSMHEQNKPVDVPDSVKLPLLSLRANQIEHGSHTPHKELWEYRAEESRWHNSISLLKAPDTINSDNTPDMVSY